MLHFGITIELKLTRQLPESTLGDLIADLNSFRKHSRISGKLRGMPNHVWNIYDETEYDEVSDAFGGALRIYAETDGRADLPVEDIQLICDKYEVAIVHLVRKWLV